MMTRMTTLAIILAVAGLTAVSAQAQIGNQSAVDLSLESINSQATSMNCGGCEAKSEEKKACCKESTCEKEGGCKAGEAKKEGCAKKEEAGCTKNKKAEGAGCPKKGADAAE